MPPSSRRPQNPGQPNPQRELTELVKQLDTLTTTLGRFVAQIDAAITAMGRLAATASASGPVGPGFGGAGHPGVGMTRGLGNQPGGGSVFVPGYLSNPALAWANNRQSTGLGQLTNAMYGSGPWGTVANLGIGGLQAANNFANFQNANQSVLFPGQASFGNYVGQMAMNQPVVGGLLQRFGGEYERGVARDFTDIANVRGQLGRDIGGARAAADFSRNSIANQNAAARGTAAGMQARADVIDGLAPGFTYTRNILGRQDEQTGRLRASVKESEAEELAANAAAVGARFKSLTSGDRAAAARKESDDANREAAFHKQRADLLRENDTFGTRMRFVMAGRRDDLVNIPLADQNAWNRKLAAGERLDQANNRFEADAAAARDAQMNANQASLRHWQSRAALSQNQANVFREEQMAGLGGAASFGMMAPGMQQNLLESVTRIKAGAGNFMDFQLASSNPATAQFAQRTLEDQNKNDPTFRKIQDVIGQRGADEAGRLADNAQGEADRLGAKAAAAFAKANEKAMTDFGKAAADAVDNHFKVQFDAFIARLEERRRGDFDRRAAQGGGR